MSDHWEVYITGFDQHLASIVVDVGLASAAPDSNRPWCLQVRIPFLSPNEDGFYRKEEGPTIGRIEDALIASFSRVMDAVHVGCITTNGGRSFVFYARCSDGLEEAVQTSMTTFPEYESKFQSENDPDWRFYFAHLYPSPHDWQRIQNRWVIGQLQQQGDSLEIARPVSHWAYFPEAKAGLRFAQAVGELGFEVLESLPSPELEKSLSYGVHFQRDDQVDWSTMNQVTIELYELAAACEGEYDGWETPIVAQK